MIVLTRAWSVSSESALKAARRRMSRIADLLETKYGTPPLGNLPDALDEAVYILITYQTDLVRAQRVWRDLKTRFRAWPDVLNAPASALEDVLRPSGFQRSRARIIRALLADVFAKWGDEELRPLRDLPTIVAEAELRALPGIDIKGARCVLMYALDRKVFPVDSNTYRFMQRYGVVAEAARYRRKPTHDQLQHLVAPRDRLRLHVNLVAHGQQTCVPRSPRCSECVVRHMCRTGASAPTARAGRTRANARPLAPHTASRT